MRYVMNSILAGLLLAASANAASMTGWISDASCGAANASSKPESRDCAARCIKEGAQPVFVSEGDNKVYKLADGTKAKGFLKGKVKVTGDVKNDTLTIAGIEQVGE